MRRARGGSAGNEPPLSVGADLRLTVHRIEGLRAILVAADGTTIETICARLPHGARPGSVVRVRVPDNRGRPDWARAVLDPAAERTVRS